MIVELYFTVDGASELSVVNIVVGDVFCIVVVVVSGAFVVVLVVSGAFVVVGSGFLVVVVVVTIFLVDVVVGFGASVVESVKILLVGAGALVVDSVYDFEVIICVKYFGDIVVVPKVDV
jgi:hypothetical protein